MNRLDHLLVIFNEECVELAQEIDKALRFGIHEQRDLPTSNLDRIRYEFNQLMAMRMMLDNEGVSIPMDDEVVRAKIDKVERYLEYSKELGRLT